MSIIKQNVSRIMNLVASSCNQVHRLSTEVCPIVVTKNRTAREVQEMYDLGFRHFAENRVEKLLERQEQFPQEDIIWHLIGPLQKRKVKQVINRIDL
jgi:cell division protein ylmE